MLEPFAKAYFITLYDYQRPSTGLLVSSGAGIMSAVMDACPVFRWCLDIDENPDPEWLARFLVCADVLVNPFGVVGWFSITPPGPLQNALRRLPNLGRVMAYTQQATMPAGFHFDNLGDFIVAANSFQALTSEILHDVSCWRSRGTSITTGERVDSTVPSFRIAANEKDFASDADALAIRADCERHEDNGVQDSETLLGETPAQS